MTIKDAIQMRGGKVDREERERGRIRDTVKMTSMTD